MLPTLAPQRRQGTSELLVQHSVSKLDVVAGEGLVRSLDLEQEMSLATLLFLYLRIALRIYLFPQILLFPEALDNFHMSFCVEVSGYVAAFHLGSQYLHCAESV